MAINWFFILYDREATRLAAGNSEAKGRLEFFPAKVSNGLAKYPGYPAKPNHAGNRVSLISQAENR